MNVTVNQLRQEMTTLVQAHEMVNSFFWGDFHRSYNEQTPLYPLVCSYLTYNTMLDNMSNDNLVIIICDKTYKDYSNLNDTESDTKQVARHLFNVIRQSPRWNDLLRVNSATMSKFIDDTSDEVAGVILTLNVNLKSSRSLCDLPLDNYSFDGDFEGETCAPVLIVNSNQTFTFSAASGTIVELANTPVRVTDQNQNELANVNLPSVTGGTIEVDIQPFCAPVTYTITRDNQPFDSGSIASGGDLVVNVPSLCAPATFNLNGVEVGTAASGGELNVPVKNTANTQVGSLISGEFIVPDATANIQLLGVTQQTVSIASGVTANIQALPNVPEFGPRKSGQTLISLPNDATNNLLGMGATWWNLRPTPNNINCFGNYKRFTNVIGNYQDEISGTYFNAAGVALGTQTFAAAFPSGIVIDWFSRFPSADGTRMFVYGWAIESVSGLLNRLAADNYCNGLTVGGFGVWKLPKKVNFDLLANESMLSLSNYIPLSSSAAPFGGQFWTEDTAPATNGASRYTLTTANAPYQRNRDPLELNRALPIRIFEIVQTGSGFVLI